MVYLKNVHPGEILREKFLYPMHLSQNELARRIGVSPRRVNEIVLGKRMITPDTALRLAKLFNVSAYLWLNLQTAYDLEKKSKELKLILRNIKVFRN